MAASGKFGIISDLHSNLEAMKVVLKWLHREGIENIVCLGDIVGYNANPVEVTYLTNTRCQVAIKGNHDRYVLGFKPKGVREEKLRVIDWTREQMSPQYLQWIQSLKDSAIYQERFMLAHGSPRDPDEYITNQETIRGSMKMLAAEHPEVQLCFFGHTHFPMVIGAGKIERSFRETRTVQLQKGETYLINPGSLGQPRDKSPKASFGVFDADSWKFSIIRLDYDHESTAATIIEAGLDRGLATRLSQGR